MGVFDFNKTNKKYNNAIPNYDIDDGVDIVPCNKKNCPYRDEDKNRCVFEACIKDSQYPFSILHHSSITRTCYICKDRITITLGNSDMPVLRLASFVCDNCINKIRKLSTTETQND